VRPGHRHGGIFFAVLVLRPATREDPASGAREGRTLGLIAAGAAVVVLAQALSIAIQLALLVDELGWPLEAAFATTYVRASVAKALVCLVMIGARSRSADVSEAAGGPSWSASAGARPFGGLDESRRRAARAPCPLLGLDALHQLATACGGGLIHLIVVAARTAIARGRWRSCGASRPCRSPR